MDRDQNATVMQPLFHARGRLFGDSDFCQGATASGKASDHSPDRSTAKRGDDRSGDRQRPENRNG